MKVRFATALAIGLLVLSSPRSHAVSPLTPTLEDGTRTDLLSRLERTGFPEVGRNSVVLAITSALGLEPSVTRYDYDVPYDHLPRVAVVATRLSDRCSAVSAVAGARSGTAYATTTVTGTYCLVGAGRWRSVDQRVAVGSS